MVLGLVDGDCQSSQERTGPRDSQSSHRFSGECTARAFAVESERCWVQWIWEGTKPHIHVGNLGMVLHTGDELLGMQQECSLGIPGKVCIFCLNTCLEP